jgi:hypothetical protein
MVHARWLAVSFALLLAACPSDPGVDEASSGGSTTEAGSSEGGTTQTPATTTGEGSTSSGADGGSSSGASSGTGTVPKAGRVHVVLFTHIEDASPPGMLGSPESIMQYTTIRSRMIEMAELAQSHDVQWVLQPDWKILEAALQYEDAETMAATNDKNFLRYLREDLGAVIDPHSHENGGYNYTDVAYLLEMLLETEATTVIGGHIWDPALPQFQEWDRFREPVAGLMYPEALWRGDILIGAGTPNHVNDPLVSGVWRPQDRDNYFVDDPAGNIVSVGAWHHDALGVQELVDLYADDTVPADRLLTASWNINPTQILADGGLEEIETGVLLPLVDLRDAGLVVLTDFTTLVETWQTDYGGEAFLHQP